MSNDDTPVLPPPPRRAPRDPGAALRRAFRHRMNDHHLLPDNDPEPPPSEPADGLSFPLRSIPKWVPREDK